MAEKGSVNSYQNPGQYAIISEVLYIPCYQLQLGGLLPWAVTIYRVLALECRVAVVRL